MKRIVKDPKTVRAVVRLVTPVIILAGLIAVPWLFTPGAADLYGREIFPVISLPFNVLSGSAQISLTENIVIVGGLSLFAGLIIFIIRFTVKLLGRGGAARFAVNTVSTVLIIAIPFTAVYQLMHGIGYRRTPVTAIMKLPGGKYTIDDYRQALDWAYYNMTLARTKLGEDYIGVAHTGGSFESDCEYANGLIDSFSEKYDIGLSRNFVRAKPVSLSKYWSLTRIVGMYDPFLGEANVNTGYVDVTSFPVTVCHELCHAKGFASETDCNIIAVLACTMSNRQEFRYAGYYYIFWELYGIVADYVKHKGGQLPEYMNSKAMAQVYRDMAASRSYWKNIDEMWLSELIAELSEDANDAVLKANGTEGVSTYQIPRDIYLDYYMIYVKPLENKGG